MSTMVNTISFADVQPAGKISFREKVGYGLGDTASNFYWQMFLNFLLFFYTDVFGITAAAAGTMFLVVRTWDTGIDPFMGVMADRTHTRWGHYRPYLLWGALPLAVVGVLMFTTPSLTAHGKLIYAYVTYSLIMVAYTFINIPYSALMGVISPNSLERTSVSSYRFVLAYGGLFMVQGLTLPMVKFFGHGNDQRGFQMAMVVYGILAIALFLCGHGSSSGAALGRQETGLHSAHDHSECSHSLVLFHSPRADRPDLYSSFADFDIVCAHLAPAVGFLRGYRRPLGVEDRPKSHRISIFGGIILPETGLDDRRRPGWVAAGLFWFPCQRNPNQPGTNRDSLHDELHSRGCGFSLRSRCSFLQA